MNEQKTAEEKRALRRQLREKLRELTEAERTAADAAICRAVQELPTYRRVRTVFCFVGIRKEIRTVPLIEAMLRDGKRVAVPRCGAPGQMDACEIHVLSELRPGQYGIPEPGENAEVLRPEEIELALLPCLAVRPDGLRLGQGGGYYDRFLAAFSGVSAVLCRSTFVREDIPVEPHDLRADWIVSEAGARRCIRQRL